MFDLAFGICFKRNGTSELRSRWRLLAERVLGAIFRQRSVWSVLAVVDCCVFEACFPGWVERGADLNRDASV